MTDDQTLEAGPVYARLDRLLSLAREQLIAALIAGCEQIKLSRQVYGIMHGRRGPGDVAIGGMLEPQQNPHPSQDIGRCKRIARRRNARESPMLTASKDVPSISDSGAGEIRREGKQRFPVRYWLRD